MTLYAFTDGASRGNPGESGIGVLVKDDKGTIVLSLNGFIGRSTNNRAEYVALITLLERMQKVPCGRLIVRSDSELMVRQVNGKYKVKDKEIQRHHRRVAELVAGSPFAFELKHIPREKNGEADRLANQAIDLRLTLEPEPRLLPASQAGT
jgi:ribonuclease HI